MTTLSDRLKDGNNALLAVGAAAALGAAAVLGLAHLWRPAVCHAHDNDKPEVTKGDAGSLWTQGYSHPDGTPEGFTMRGAVSAETPTGHETFLELWDANTAEPPHAHPGDDMTVVIEGHMSVQFFKQAESGLVPDGPRLHLRAGQTGYIAAGRIHDAQYHEACKLVYVHSGAFGFEEKK